MGLTEDVAYVGSLLDAFSETYYRMGEALDDPDDAGVPRDMRSGPVNADGSVQWHVLPSTLSERDVAAIEGEFGVAFPPLFRAYLLARFHLFDQVQSARYGQLIFMTAVPSGRKLDDLRSLIRAWRPLERTGFVPFAQWGDGWGPMCFDVQQRADDGECPIVWMDHEELIPLDLDLARRSAVLPLVRPLYGSCREFLCDVFDVRARNGT